MEYRILDLSSVVAYVRAHPDAAALLDVAGSLEAQEISDGNLNAVFRITRRTGRAASWSSRACRICGWRARPGPSRRSGPTSRPARSSGNMRLRPGGCRARTGTIRPWP